MSEQAKLTSSPEHVCCIMIMIWEPRGEGEGLMGSRAENTLV